MKVLILSLALLTAALVVAPPADAGPCRGKAQAHRSQPCGDCVTAIQNPDGRTSITLTAGTGNINGFVLNGGADVRTLGVALVYPAARDLSLLARFDHGKTEWDGAPARCGPTDFDSDLWTVGVRLYLGR